MTQDLAHRRPWLLASLFFGIIYPLPFLQVLPGLYLMIWKMVAVGLLVGYVLRRHHSGEFAMLAVVLALCALGDGLVEISLEAGAIAFSAAHILVIWLYSRHRRESQSASQKLLAVTVLIAAPIIAYALDDILAAAYTALLAAMAAMAWTSSFPRYRVGIGAMLFVASDLFLFGREGGILSAMPAINLIVWYLYYAGILLIATGIVQTLVKRGFQAE